MLHSIAYLRDPWISPTVITRNGMAPVILKVRKVINPFEARIFAVVDVWDALTSDRPYRKAWSKPDTLQYIREQSGKHFDPKVVDVFSKRVCQRIALDLSRALLNFAQRASWWHGA